MFSRNNWSFMKHKDISNLQKTTTKMVSNGARKWSRFYWDHFSNSKWACLIRDKNLVVTDQRKTLFTKGNDFKIWSYFGPEKVSVLTTWEDLSVEETHVFKEVAKTKKTLLKNCYHRLSEKVKNTCWKLRWKEVVVVVFKLYSNIKNCEKKFVVFSSSKISSIMNSFNPCKL